MNPDHHLNRSQRYLDFTANDIAAGDCARAARALSRAATHAVTAAAVHWHHRHHSRRRLGVVVGALLRDGRLRAAHWRTFREVGQLPAQIAAAPDAARRLLRRARRRVSRLRTAIAAAMSAQPNPPTLAELMAQVAAQPLPPPPPFPQTRGELNRLLGRYVDPDYADHPLDCHGCHIHYHGPIPAPSDHSPSAIAPRLTSRVQNSFVPTSSFPRKNVIP